MKAYIQSTLFISAVVFTCHCYAQTTNARFSAPNINSAHKDFLKRTNQSLVNIDFIIANALGERNKAINEGTNNIDGVIDENTPNSTNSVIVLPGADADNVTIININEGDGTVISR